MPENQLWPPFPANVASSHQSLYLNDFLKLELRQRISLEVFECPILSLRLRMNLPFKLVIYLMKLSTVSGLLFSEMRSSRFLF